MSRSAKFLLTAAAAITLSFGVLSFGLAHAAEKKPEAKPAAPAAAAPAPVAAPVEWTAPKYGYGRIATAEEIEGWDRTVRASDGKGLPAGKGDAEKGEEIFQSKCGMCHGDFGEGTRYLALAGGKGTLASPDPIRTVGSFWPYAPGVFGYIYTSMPFGQAHSLTPDETYSIVAYIMYLNDLFPQSEELNADKLRAIKMPNRDGFIEGDPRPDMPQPAKGAEPCMKDCRGGKPVVVLSRANDLNLDGAADANKPKAQQ
jgi:S-disulfanyl-L-cysteine oxidoreductase SoxD